MHAISMLFVLFLFACAPAANASCGVGGCPITMLGKGQDIDSESRGRGWYFNYIYNQVVWDNQDAHEIHELHHDGHDVHNRAVDVKHHYQLGRQVNDDWKVFVDLPYVEYSFIEIDDHDHLGARQHSKGLGDLQLLSEYRFWHNGSQSLGLAGGFQFPTGSTRQNSFQGERFETEFQPGSGAYNYILGGFYNYISGRAALHANTSYVLTTRGAQGFEFGDLYTVSLEASYVLNPQDRHLKTRLGMDTVFKAMGKEESYGVKNPDSGGHLLLLGPALKVGITDNIDLTGTFLYPVIQEFNGLAQETKFDWILGTQIRF